MTPTEAIASVPTDLFVAGSWRATARTMPVENPATGEILTHVADADADEAMTALDAAATAQPDWARTPARERSEILYRAFELLHAEVDRLATIMTLEMGKPLAESKGEIAYAAEFFRWFAEEAVRIDGGHMRAPAGGARFLVSKQPVGPCVLITPWNFPMAMGTRKIGPAIAAGCTSVIKPAEATPLSTLALADILQRAGLPDGVVNVVTTSRAGEVMEPLLLDDRSRKLSFTGSTAVGKKLLAQAAQTVMRTSMELGGNAPLIVFDDADMDTAIAGTIAAKLRNIGQACTAANRIFVHTSVAEEFTRRLTEEMAARRMGPGLEEGVTIGPLIDDTAVQKVASLVRSAADGGAKVLLGGVPDTGPGHFFPATVVTDVPAGAELGSTEIFGPVAAVSTFTDEDEVIARANATPHGLVSYVFTESLRRGLRVSDALEAGMVGLNQGVVSNPAAPFGGVKESGLGREGGFVGIEEFLDTKYIGIPD
ncbi:NAD-dependent succinate-semialdehyde dehydrogenase [Ruania suaedae]|uniref:NAD-dependent succinate-semialdehyde dehydrogenase n=1 Tax=Ruania suaedae TaxID=2897774 RepID=UPI001E31461B|nr:NAD-dependent succinate-semialdehyde dehydrogenase [Ruania suaedae]UFU02269.1 NAD-dependent succinate-semialdehyde dehydrogenase [Ruania suaedae]